MCFCSRRRRSREVSESGEGGGSTAMPQKRNAVGAMRARACAELARGHASVLIGGLSQEHERAAGLWQAEWEALSGALQYSGGAAAALAGSLEGLEVDEARMRANLDLTGGQIARRANRARPHRAASAAPLRARSCVTPRFAPATRDGRWPTSSRASKQA